MIKTLLSGEFYIDGKKSLLVAFFFLVVSLFSFLSFFKIQYHTINTIPQPCRRWTIIENVSQVGFAPATFPSKTKALAMS